MKFMWVISTVNFVWRFIDLIIGILMTAMVILVFTNVVMRYGFSSGLRPSVELSRLGFVWIVMLGAAVVLKRGEHLAITDVTEALVPKMVPFFRRVSLLVIIVSVSLLFWGATKQALANWNNISQLTGLPKGLLYVPGGISGLLMLFVAIYQFFQPIPNAEENVNRDFTS